MFSAISPPLVCLYEKKPVIHKVNLCILIVHTQTILDQLSSCLSINVFFYQALLGRKNRKLKGWKVRIDKSKTEKKKNYVAGILGRKDGKEKRL